MKKKKKNEKKMKKNGNYRGMCKGAVSCGSRVHLLLFSSTVIDPKQKIKQCLEIIILLAFFRQENSSDDDFPVPRSDR